MMHAHRGRAWEVLLERWHDRYRKDRLAVVFRAPPPVKVLSRVGQDGTFRACFASDGPPDYLGALAGGRTVAFDAKDCAGTRWAFGQLERHQARDLEAVHITGGLSFVALRLGGLGWVLPWETLGPRWWAWFGTPGRAAPGEGSLSRDDLERLAWPMPEAGDWLSAVAGRA